MKVSLPGTKWNYYVRAYWSWYDFRIGVAYLKNWHTWRISLPCILIVLEQG